MAESKRLSLKLLSGQLDRRFESYPLRQPISLHHAYRASPSDFILPLKAIESAASFRDRRMRDGYGLAQAEMDLRPRTRDYVWEGGDVRTTRRPVLTAYH